MWLVDWMILWDVCVCVYVARFYSLCCLLEPNICAMYQKSNLLVITRRDIIHIIHEGQLRLTLWKSEQKFKSENAMKVRTSQLTANSQQITQWHAEDMQ